MCNTTCSAMYPCGGPFCPYEPKTAMSCVQSDKETPTSFAEQTQKKAQHLPESVEDSIPDRRAPTAADALRPAVLSFALAMEAKLRANDHKGGWEDERSDWLFGRLLDEAVELRLALIGGDKNGAGNEAVDVANFAMMLRDNIIREEEGDEILRHQAAERDVDHGERGKNADVRLRYGSDVCR